jgi:hypothetical protein
MSEKPPLSELSSAPSTPAVALARDPTTRAPNPPAFELSDLSLRLGPVTRNPKPPRSKFAKWWETHISLKVPIEKSRDHLGFLFGL